ncbi:polymorphic toxin type 50 domain-containing protein [Thalassotalea sp. PS06]|uniref:polymorphic toxin type 50 domain-containing protein n=1 Tax=Thalassotalea sp. PS06 TaxID=2594005 RepID=UPI00116265B5|nr:polymorphic toxin type 50 domain-containing protein [Thalassotalea sp. PS06]QDP01563.1 hypothetical protein FNC98_09580 [Thalassotalea sp. PS06]
MRSFKYLLLLLSVISISAISVEQHKENKPLKAADFYYHKQFKRDESKNETREKFQFDISHLEKISKENLPKSVKLKNNLPVYLLPVNAKSLAQINQELNILGVGKVYNEYASTGGGSTPEPPILPTELYVQYDPQVSMGLTVTWEQGVSLEYALKMRVDGSPVYSNPVLETGNPEDVYFGLGAGFSIEPALSGYYEFELEVWQDGQPIHGLVSDPFLAIPYPPLGLPPSDPFPLVPSTSYLVDPTPQAPISGDEHQVNADVVLDWGSYQGFYYGLQPDATYFELRYQLDGGGFNAWENIGYVSWLPLDELAAGIYDFELRACNDNGCSLPESLFGWEVLSPSFDIMSVEDALIQPLSDSALSDSESIATLQGEVTIDGGLFNYSIPLQVPIGRRNLAPSVALNYSSQNGNGIAGKGWSISAGESVSRCGHIFGLDGDTLNVRWSTADKLCLNGQRLIRTGGSSYGSNGAVYKTEKDSGVIVTQLGGGINDTATYFEIVNKSGLKKLFGFTNESRYSPEWTTKTLHWKLFKVSDLFDNNIIYYYDTLDNTHVLDEIRYTGSGATPGNRQIKFSYSDTFERLSYLYGKKITSNKKLKSVNLYSPTNEKHYVLNYKASNSELLESVSLCANSNCQDKIAQTTFGWSEQAFGINKRSHVLSYISDPASDVLMEAPAEVTADLDGDGTPDLQNRYNYFLSSQDYMSSSRAALVDAHPGVDPSNNTGLNKMNGYLDFDGDGKSEIVYLNDNNTWNITWLDDTNTIIETNIDGTCKFDPYLWEDLMDEPVAVKHNLKRDCQSFIADVNGDGHKDIVSATRQVTQGPSTYKIYERNKDAQGQSLPGFSYYATVTGWKNGGIADINGDGKTDLYNADESSWIDIKAGTGSVTHDLTSDDSVYGVREKKTIWLDLNGDGLQDFLVLKPVGSGQTLVQNWHAVMNQGGGYFTSPIDTGVQEQLGRIEGSYLTPYTDESSMSGFVRVFDYDQDGQMDLLVPGNIRNPYICTDASKNQPCDITAEDSGKVIPYYQYDVYSWDVLQTNNDGTSFVLIEDIGIEAALSTLSLLDYNRDGHTDFFTSIGYEHQYSSTPNSGYIYESTASPEVRLYQRVTHDNDLITSISDRHGIASKIVYKTLSDDHEDERPIYTHGHEGMTDSRYARFGSDMKVVSKMEARNGVGGFNATEYSYDEAILHKQGRGFQGFRYIVAKDLAADKTTVSGFMQRFPFTGMVSSTSTWQSSVYENEVQDEFNAASSSGTPDEERYKSPSLIFDEAADTAGSYNYLSYSRSKDPVEYWDQSCSSEIKAPRFTNHRVKTRTIDGAWIGEVITNDFEYNCDGDLLKKTVTTNDVTAKHIQKIENSYSVCTADSNFNQLDWAKTTVSATPKALSTWEGPASGESWKKQDFNQYQGCALPLTTHNTASNSSLTLTTQSTLDDYGNIKRTTMSSSGPGESIQGNRWKESSYHSDGYFVNASYNSQWGMGVAESELVAVDDYTGQPLVTRDVNGLEAHVVLDQYGQISSSSTQKAGVEITPAVYMAYQVCEGSDNCPTNAVTIITKVQDGAPTQKSYLDVNGNTVQTKSKVLGGHWSYTSKSYNALGQLTSESLPHFYGDNPGMTYYSKFDVKGRPTKKVVDQYPLGYTTDYDYRGAVTVINVAPDYVPVGGVSSFTVQRTYNLSNQLVRTTDADNGRTHFAYDGFGNPIVIEDAKGNSIQATYNGFGHKLSVDDPNMGLWSYRYNALGELRKQTDANEVDTILNYDNLGRITSKIIGNETQTWQFDSQYKGLLHKDFSSVSGNNVYERSFTYDTYGRINSQTLDIDERSMTMALAYDGYYGRLKAQQFPDGRTVAFNYDEFGYPTKDVDPTSNNHPFIERKVMNAFGNITEQVFGNGLTQYFNYILTSGLTQSICTGTSANCQSSSSAQYQSYDSYDAFGNILTREDVSGGRQEDYRYDQLHRVIANSVTFDGTSLPPISYDYDEVGNLLKKSDYGLSYSYGNSAKSAGGNAGSNAVRAITLTKGGSATLTYDENGNMLTNSDGDLSVSYNHAMKPTEISRNGSKLDFTYDANDFRVKQVRTGTDGSDSTIYYFDKFYELEIIDSGETIHRSFLGTHTLFSSKRDEASIQHLSADRLGSINVITDGTRSITDVSMGNLVLQHRFNGLFGESYTLDNGAKILKLSDFYGTTRSFTGHEELTSVAIIHMNGRVYDYNLGRFMSVDPFIYHVGNTQAINSYSYIMNNPLSGTDPTGYIAFIPVIVWAVNAYAAYETASAAADAVQSYKNGEISGSDVATTVAASAIENTVLKKVKVAKEGIQKARQAFKGDKADSNVQNSVNKSNTDGGTKTANGASNADGGTKTTNGAENTPDVKRSKQETTNIETPSSVNSKPIHEGKQGKHQPGHNNFEEGKSELTHDNPQKLVDEHSGKGQQVGNKTVGEAGSKERVNFGENIGNHVDQTTGDKKPTTVGIIHHSKKDVHIVPAKPEDIDK